MSVIPAAHQVSESTRRRNPHLYDVQQMNKGLAGLAEKIYSDMNKPKKRLRQDSKPSMNKLEREFFAYITRLHPTVKFHVQAVTFKLANGLRYTPDFTGLINGQQMAYETKGVWVDGDSFPKLKMAATVFTDTKFVLCWKDKTSGAWQFQEILQ